MIVHAHMSHNFVPASATMDDTEVGALTAVENRCAAPKETCVRKERLTCIQRAYRNFEFDTGVGALSRGGKQVRCTKRDLYT